MKITIDTKEDSAEDIRRVVKMLQAWTEGHSNAAPFNNLFSDSPGSEPEPEIPESSPAPATSEGGLFNLFQDDNKDDNKNDESSDDSDNPQIINLDNDQSASDDDVPPVMTY